MHAICNRGNIVFRKHRAAHLAVLHGHTVHKPRQPHRDVGHVHHALVTAPDALYCLCRLVPQNALRLLHGEAVVPGRDRRVRGEDAMLAHRIQITLLCAGQRSTAQRLLQQRERQQCCMSLIHVVDADVVSQGIEHPEAANAEHDLLREPIVRVAAVQGVGQGAVARVVRLQVGVQHVDGNGVAGHAFHVIAPGANVDRASLDGDHNARLFLGQPLFRTPRLRLFALYAVRIQNLPEIPLAVHQRDRCQRQSHVRRGAQRVTREHPQAATVGGHTGLDGNLHGEIADHAFAGGQPYCIEVSRLQSLIHRAKNSSRAYVTAALRQHRPVHIR